MSSATFKTNYKHSSPEGIFFLHYVYMGVTMQKETDGVGK